MSSLPITIPSPIVYVEVISELRNSLVCATYVDDILVNLKKTVIVRDSSTQTEFDFGSLIDTASQTSPLPLTASASTQISSAPAPEDFSTEQLLHLFKHVYPQTWGKK